MAAIYFLKRSLPPLVILITIGVTMTVGECHREGLPTRSSRGALYTFQSVEGPKRSYGIASLPPRHL